MGVGLFIGVGVLAFVCELIDASLGMMYGTLLSPILIIMGYDARVVVPSILLCIRPYHYKFGWWKMIAIGLLASFNKAMSGGGFGPVTSSGEILGGLDSKTSIATTTFAKIPICLAGFIIWILLNKEFSWELPIPLLIGSFAGGLLGPWVTKRVHDGKLRAFIGILAIISGVWIVLRLFL